MKTRLIFKSVDPDFLERAQLAREVFNKVFEARETFRENHLGADLAYLLGAILDEPRAFVDWSSRHSDCDETLKLFRQLFSRKHPVWDFIEV